MSCKSHFSQKKSKVQIDITGIKTLLKAYVCDINLQPHPAR